MITELRTEMYQENFPKIAQVFGYDRVVDSIYAYASQYEQWDAQAFKKGMNDSWARVRSFNCKAPIRDLDGRTLPMWDIVWFWAVRIIASQRCRSSFGVYNNSFSSYANSFNYVLLRYQEVGRNTQSTVRNDGISEATLLQKLSGALDLRDHTWS